MLSHNSAKTNNSITDYLPLDYAQTEELEPKKRVMTLRRQLLLSLLPTVLIPLAIASWLGYRTIHQSSEEKIRQQMLDRVLLVDSTIREFLDQSIKIPALVAANPLVIDGAIAASKKAETEKLTGLPIEELEKRFASTKLLQPNSSFNQYLVTTARIGGLAEIFFTEKHGFNVAYSNPPSDFVQKDESWWQEGKKQDLWISSLEYDKSTKTQGIEIIQAIKNPKNDEFLGVVKAFLPINVFEMVYDYLEHTNLINSQSVQIFDTNQQKILGTFTSQGMTKDVELIGKDKVIKIANLLVRALKEKKDTNETEINKLAKEAGFKEFKLSKFSHQGVAETLTVSFAFEDKDYAISTITKTDWVVIASIDHQEIESAGNELIKVFALISSILGAVAFLIIAILARQLAQPLTKLSAIAQTVAKGNLNVVAQPIGSRETQTLANSFNNLVDAVKTFIQEQQIATEQAKILAKITGARSFTAEELGQTINFALQEARNFLQVDRIVIYSLHSDKSGTIAYEAVTNDRLQAIKFNICDPCIPETSLAKYRQGKTTVNHDFQGKELDLEHRKLLERLEVKSNIIVPLLERGELYGLIIAHNCSQDRSWWEPEIRFLQQIATQLGIVIERFSLLEQERIAKEQRVAKEQLQQRIIDLLIEVEPIAKGNLNIRATVTPDEIGTVADSYNATIESLRKIVIKVQTAAQKMQENTKANETVVQKLSQEAIKQADSVWLALNEIQIMTESIREVGNSAGQAELAVQQATEVVKSGDRAMNRTVEGILAIRDTVQETQIKVKNLQNSSHKISEVVNLISRFAAQTHLLALKASIEAARAGDAGQGFAVIAEEVRDLASQSAGATVKIENIVGNIFYETNQLVTAMAQGSEQVVLGTQLVEETRQSLEKIREVNGKIKHLVEAIAFSSTEQTQTTEIVAQTMAEVAIIAQENSNWASSVSNSFTELLVVAGELQKDVSEFKVN